MTSVSYQIFEDGKIPDGTRVEVTGIVTEYGTELGSCYMVPKEHDPAKVAAELSVRGIHVYQRRVVVIEDWTEVTAPVTSQGDSPR